MERGVEKYLFIGFIIVVLAVVLVDSEFTGMVVKKSTCKDSDGTKVENKGYVTFNGKKVYDSCKSGKLVEQICGKDKKGNSIIKEIVKGCSSGKKCVSGACVLENFE